MPSTHCHLHLQLSTTPITHSAKPIYTIAADCRWYRIASHIHKQSDRVGSGAITEPIYSVIGLPLQLNKTPNVRLPFLTIYNFDIFDGLTLSRSSHAATSRKNGQSLHHRLKRRHRPLRRPASNIPRPQRSPPRPQRPASPRHPKGCTRRCRRPGSRPALTVRHQTTCRRRRRTGPVRRHRS